MKTFLNNGSFGRPNPLNDYLFYKVMGEKGDEVQLLGFLNAVLGRSGKEHIESLEILENPSFKKEIEDGKSCILDLLAVLQNGTKVNIEVQLSNEHNMDRRSLFYWSRVYSTSLKEGQNYGELPNVIAINIVDFDFPPGGGFHTCFHLREDADPSLILSEALEIHCVNMVQWRKLAGKDVYNDPLHRWLAWFDKNSPPELIEEVVMTDSAVAEAYRTLERTITADPDGDRLYWAERKFEHDKIGWINYARDEGIEQGLVQGIEQGVFQVARKMKEAGDSNERIQAITGLSPEEIKQL